MIVFTQEEHNGDLQLLTDQNIKIDFVFMNGECVELQVDDGEAVFGGSDSNIHGIFVMILGKVHSLAFLVSQAEKQYQDINEETEQFEFDEDEHYSEMSSLQLTGRV